MPILFLIAIGLNFRSLEISISYTQRSDFESPDRIHCLFKFLDSLSEDSLFKTFEVCVYMVS